MATGAEHALDSRTCDDIAKQPAPVRAHDDQLGIGGPRPLSIDIGQINKAMVLNNNVVFGSVNANRRHYDLAAAVLDRADRAWLDRLISRRVSLSNWQDALKNRPDDIKVVIDFRL